jgi:cation diffusion facilitator family transporter
MAQDKSRIKLVVQRRILTFSIILFAGKIIAYFITNSVGILTDALESIVNVTTGFISLYSISIALRPKDLNHPFGHGKVESISASVEGLLILLAGIFIIFEAIRRLFVPAEIQQLDTGIIIIGVAGLINYILGYFSIKTGKKHNSIALVAGGKHLQSDTYSTIGLIAGLVILMVTKKMWIDSLIALTFGTIIIITGIRILIETTSNLMDEADIDQLARVVEIIRNNRRDTWIEIHHIRLLKYGDSHHMDCDLTLPWYMNIADAHTESDRLKEVISENYPSKIDLTVHTDACFDALCKSCRIIDCHARKEDYTNDLEWSLEKMISRDPQVKRSK